MDYYDQIAIENRIETGNQPETPETVFIMTQMPSLRSVFGRE